MDDKKLSLRDHLAIGRTEMANERTLLAYARTAIMLAVSSVTLFRLFPSNRFAEYVALALIPAAVIVAVFGGRRFYRVAQSLKQNRL